MKTAYERFIDAVACAMDSHSPEMEWFYDFDEQDTVPYMPHMDCRPDCNHHLLRIEPLDSKTEFNIMEDFVDTVKAPTDQNKLWSVLSQRHPFSAFRNILHYTNQREAWFEYKNERMKHIIERWMRDYGITYEDGLFKCDNTVMFEFDEDWDDEE